MCLDSNCLHHLAPRHHCLTNSYYLSLHGCGLENFQGLIHSRSPLGLNLAGVEAGAEAEADEARWVLPVEARRPQAVLGLGFEVACYIVRLHAFIVVKGGEQGSLGSAAEGFLIGDLQRRLTQELPHRKLLIGHSLPGCPVVTESFEYLFFKLHHCRSMAWKMRHACGHGEAYYNQAD